MARTTWACREGQTLITPPTQVFPKIFYHFEKVFWDICLVRPKLFQQNCPLLYHFILSWEPSLAWAETGLCCRKPGPYHHYHHFWYLITFSIIEFLLLSFNIVEFYGHHNFQHHHLHLQQECSGGGSDPGTSSGGLSPPFPRSKLSSHYSHPGPETNITAWLESKNWFSSFCLFFTSSVLELLKRYSCKLKTLHHRRIFPSASPCKCKLELSKIWPFLQEFSKKHNYFDWNPYNRFSGNPVEQRMMVNYYQVYILSQPGIHYGTRYIIIWWIFKFALHNEQYNIY